MRSLLLSSLFLFACGGGTAVDATATPAPSSSSTTSSPSEPQRQRPAPTTTRSTWCTQQGTHDFCADFDADDALGDWDDAIRGTDRKQKDVDEIAPSQRSKPNALHLQGSAITTEAVDDKALYPWSGMFLTKELPTTSSSKARVAFALFVDRVDDLVGVVELGGRKNGGAEIAFHVRLDVGRDATWLAAAFGPVPKCAPIATGRWVNVEIAVEEAVATLSFDGAAVCTATFEGTLASSEETTLYLGVSRDAPAGAYDVRYDDVVVDLH